MDEGFVMLRGRTFRVALGVTLAALATAGALDSGCSSSAATSNGGVTVYKPYPHLGLVADGNGHTLKNLGAVTDPGAGGFLLTISGEVNALTSYPYPPFD